MMIGFVRRSSEGRSPYRRIGSCIYSSTSSSWRLIQPQAPHRSLLSVTVKHRCLLTLRLSRCSFCCGLSFQNDAITLHWPFSFITWTLTVNCDVDFVLNSIFLLLDEFCKTLLKELDHSISYLSSVVQCFDWDDLNVFYFCIVFHCL